MVSSFYFKRSLDERLLLLIFLRAEPLCMAKWSLLEAGFIHTPLRLNRKVVVGNWSDTEVQDRIAARVRAARA
jgi:hypothetical protein